MELSAYEIDIKSLLAFLRDSNKSTIDGLSKTAKTDWKHTYHCLDVLEDYKLIESKHEKNDFGYSHNYYLTEQGRIFLEYIEANEVALSLRGIAIALEDMEDMKDFEYFKLSRP